MSRSSRSRDFPYQFTRADLGFSLFERFDSRQDPKYMNAFLAKAGTPISKVLHLLLGRGWLHGGVYRAPETLVPLPDGAHLATDVFMPKRVFKKRRRAPTILIRTPYWKDSIAFIGHYLALNGYAAVIQDLRGCAHSSPYGSNTFLMSEREDGLATARWISQRFWYDGKIGMWGGSYFGMTQWAVSWDNEGLITCMVPLISSNQMLWSAHNGLEMNGIKCDFARILHEVTKFKDPQPDARLLAEYTHQLTEAMRLDPRHALYNDPVDMSNYRMSIADLEGLDLPSIQARLKRELGLDLPFAKRDFPQFLNLINEMLWKRHVNLFSKYMTGMLDYDPAHHQTPMYVVGGWYDMFSRVSIEAWCEFQAHAPRAVREASKMVIGPWAHGAMGRDRLNFFNAGWHNFLKHLAPVEWFDYWLKGEHNEIGRMPPVKIFVMGRNRWRYEQEWPLARAETRAFYLHSGGRANSRHGDGKLSWEAPGREHEDAYNFHPLDPVLTRGGNNLQLPKGVFDQRAVEDRKDVLVYTSAPLERGVEISGPVEMVLYAASTAEDTDFMVKLVDVAPNGRALNLLDRGVRARYRDYDFDHPSLLEPGKVYEYHVPIGHTANFFKPKHRIRVDVTSSDFPKYDINANMGGKGGPGAWKIAQQTIFHDAAHPSQLVLPVVPSE